MKYNILFALLFFAFPFQICAQEDDSEETNAPISFQMPIDDPDLDFSEYEFKEKHGKVEFKKGKLILECKDNKKSVIAVSEVRKADPRNADITFSCPITFSKFDKEHKSGIIFNYRNEDNYHALVFDKDYYYYIIKDRGEDYTEQRSKYKRVKNYNPTKNTITPEIKIKGRKITIVIDGIEMGEIKLERSIRGRKYGFYTDGESELEISAPLTFTVLQHLYDEEDDYQERDNRYRDY